MSIYHEHFFNVPINIKSLISILYYDISKEYYFAGEKHDFWELVYVDQGSVVIIRNNDKVIAKEGDLILHNPNEFHSINGDGENSARFFIMTFRSECKELHAIRNYHMKVNKEREGYIRQIYLYSNEAFVSCKAIDGVMSIKTNQSQPYGCEQLIKMNIEALLISIIRNNYEVDNADKESYSKKVLSIEIDNINKYINDNIDSIIDLDNVSKVTGMSIRKIQYCIKQKYDMTFCNYVRDIRIERAKKLLRDSEDSITQIAEKTGYSSIHYFSSQFKKVTGVTPTEYAKSIKIEGDKLSRHRN